MIRAEDLIRFVHEISFRYIQPRDRGIFLGSPNMTGIDFDIQNTMLPTPKEEESRKLVEHLCLNTLRMSTYAVGAIINHIARHMDNDEAYVNIGVWNGFTLLAGMVGNGEKRCIGVDNFSKFGGPKDQFMAEFQKYKSRNHSFYECDYKDYFTNMHSGSIGAYFYDGDHSEENQCEGLSVAEEYFSKNAVVIIDDFNRPDVVLGTNRYIQKTKLKFRLICDFKTANDGHPTFWDGLAIMQRTD